MCPGSSDRPAGHGDPPEQPGASARRGVAASWRLIVHDEGDPYWNMAVDTAMHDAAESGLAPPTLRFYRWSCAAVTIGCHQNAARSLDLKACAALGVPVVRRPTGGRGILHGSDQTVSIVVGYDRLGGGRVSVDASYRLFAAGFRDGLEALGVRLMAGREHLPAAGIGDCFALRTPADLVTAEGHKLVGSAQHRGRTALLQQSSVLHVPSAVDPRRLFLGPPAHTEYPLRSVDEAELIQALSTGFAAALGVRFGLDTLSQWEVERASVVMAALRARPVVDTG